MSKEKNLSKLFELQFSGLKFGNHDFEFDIPETFFEVYPAFDFVSKGELKINLSLEKKSTMLILNTKVKGNVTTACDRCGDDVATSIENDFKLIVKFGDKPFEDNDEIIQIPESSYKLELLNLFYEYILVSMPLRFVHEEGKCNKEVMDKLSKHLVEEEEEEKIDPRWDALKNLK